MESSEITTKTCRQAQLCSTEVQQDLSWQRREYGTPTWTRDRRTDTTA